MDEIIGKKLVIEDLATETIWIDKWEKFNKFNGSKSLKGAQKLLHSLPDSTAKETCRVAFFEKPFEWFAGSQTPECSSAIEIPEHLNTHYLSR
jgi:hypothetical protein